MKTKKRKYTIHKTNLNKLAVILISFLFIMTVVPKIKSEENFSSTQDVPVDLNSQYTINETIDFKKGPDTNNGSMEDNHDVTPSPVPPAITDIPSQYATGNSTFPTNHLNDTISDVDNASNGITESYSNNITTENRDQPVTLLLSGQENGTWVNVTKEVYPTIIHPGEPATISINVTAEGEPSIISTPVAVLLVIDTSGSMDWEYENETGVPHPALYYIKHAATTFIDQMDLTNDTIGVVSFAQTATLRQGLTHDATAAKNAVNRLTASGSTNTGEGIRKAQQELTAHCPSDAFPIILLFTDGLPTAHHPGGSSCGDNCPTSNNSCTDYARNQATDAKDAGTTIFSIGFIGGITTGGCGSESVAFAEWLLKDIASGEECYYGAPDVNGLEEIYLNISQSIYEVILSNLVVTDYLPSHFIITNTGGGYYSVLPDGTHEMIFTRSFLALNDSWNINFEVTTQELGELLLTNLEESNLTYNLEDTPCKEYLPYPRYITVTTPLEIEKNAPLWINQGEQFNYSITITNIGHMTLDIVTVTDPLSNKVTFNSVDSNYGGFNEDNWDYVNHTLTISDILLDSGDTIGFIISVTVLDGVSGDIINTAYSGYSTSNGCIVEDICNSSVTTHINSPPVVNDIPDQTISEGSTFTTINLDNYVSDVDNIDAQMTWTYSGNSQLMVSIVDRVATVIIPSLDWNGAETITFKATDPGALFDDDAALFTVTAENDPPVVSGISDQTIAEGSTFATINLDDYVTDVDNTDAQMTWTYSGNSQLMVSIVDRVATVIIPSLDWNGVETITFTATDSGGLSDFDDVVFTVTAVNDPPVLDPVGSQSGDELTLISFTATASDVDIPAQTLTFSLEGGVPSGASIGELSGVFEWTPSEDQGPAVYTFDVVVSDGIDSDSETITITIDEVNLNPVLDPIGSKSIEEETLLTFTAIASDDDIPLQALAFRLEDGNSGNVPSGALITSGGIFTWTPTEEQSPGVYTFDVVVKDDDLAEDRETITVTVDEVNDPPIVSNIPDQTVLESETFKTINLDDYVEDVDGPDGDIEWNYSGNVELSVDITDCVTTITIPDADWNGQETITFRATDTGLLWDEDAATFTVTAENDPPVVNDILDQTINEGQTFTTINLDNYVTDVDNLDSEMTWTYTGNTELTITIADRIATITIPNENWNGAETITFIGTDPGGLYDEDAAMFTVTTENDLPVVSDIPDQTIFEGASFVAINLDDYVMDVEDLDLSILWSHSGTVELSVDITNRIASIGIPDQDWNGQEAITFRATDTGGLWDEDVATFTVIAVNDPPVTFNDEYGTDEDTPLYVSAPGILGNDVDTDGPQSLAVSLVDDVANGTLNFYNNGSFFYIPGNNWFGVDSFIYQAYDGENYSNPATVTIIVSSVNDPPNIPTDPNPTSGETNVDITLVLSWRGTNPGALLDPDGDPITFDVYIGTNNTPPLIVHNQSNTSYDPSVNYDTTYYWRVIVWDNHNASNASELWNFTTKLPPSGGGGSSNINPVADSSAGKPYQGFINEEITFNGSRSYDPDGIIISWYWTFGDGTHGNGKTTTHTYLNEGTYHATLTVTDNNGDTGTDSFTVAIVKANHPPSIPSIDGPVTGHQNSTLEFTALSFDADNDTIQYIFDWGDGETSRSDFLENGTVVLQTHQWANYGEYHITVTAFDNETGSGARELTIFIDVLPIDDDIQGYLVDVDSELTYDSFDNTNTGQQTGVEKEDNNTYLIDSNGDGKWDYVYNLESGLTTYYDYVYQKYDTLFKQLPKTPGFEMISLLAMIALVFIILRRRK